ncbi:MAG: VOC family protein [Microbacterium sp.]|uniref:VOC family protein n=1 Tax=Microbacterium TaxID=33882 RepID=UPI000C470B40|nr:MULTISPECIES: VOC family protein [Microbacterium]MAY48662.1 VOC family protein [Microbacterium sp.]HAS32200.1 VOC family protein [Microbacterium sp.]HBR89188.1 VOC family protein [Microbacterium sp.]HBS74417.1 VOC family protein [Microbacterium sp.]|tara:strand:- start:1621 stop:2034 length:414 start_codon:yes stop_codon:yes gene_type:complete
MTTTAAVPYFCFPGNARQALERYARIFGGDLDLHTYAAFGRTDGPEDDIAHGMLTGPVTVFACDAGADEDGFHSVGLFLSLLDAAPVDDLRRWFAELSAGGRVIDPLQKRAWGDWDGQVRDAFGVTWLIGFSGMTDD